MSVESERGTGQAAPEEDRGARAWYPRRGEECGRRRQWAAAQPERPILDCPLSGADFSFFLLFFLIFVFIFIGVDINIFMWFRRRLSFAFSLSRSIYYLFIYYPYICFFSPKSLRWEFFPPPPAGATNETSKFGKCRSSALFRRRQRRRRSSYSGAVQRSKESTDLCEVDSLLPRYCSLDREYLQVGHGSTPIRMVLPSWFQSPAPFPIQRWKNPGELCRVSFRRK